MEEILDLGKSMDDKEFNIFLSQLVKTNDEFIFTLSSKNHLEIALNYLKDESGRVDIYSSFDIEDEMSLSLLDELDFRIVSNVHKDLENFHFTEKESSYSFFILFGQGKFIYRDDYTLYASYNNIHKYNELLTEFNHIIT